MTLDTIPSRNTSPLLVKRILIGSLVNLLVLSLILVATGELAGWIWIPMLTVSIAGAIGGIIYHVLNDRLEVSNGKRWALIAFSILIHLIGFWLGMVFALAQVGLWN